jgi:hypothetical protein
MLRDMVSKLARLMFNYEFRWIGSCGAHATVLEIMKSLVLLTFLFLISSMDYTDVQAASQEETESYTGEVLCVTRGDS